MKKHQTLLGICACLVDAVAFLSILANAGIVILIIKHSIIPVIAYILTEAVIITRFNLRRNPVNVENYIADLDTHDKHWQQNMWRLFVITIVLNLALYAIVFF